MSDETHVSVAASIQDLEQIVEECGLSGDTSHGDLYLNFLEDGLRVVQATPAETLISYGRYGVDYFKEYELERDVDTHEGEQYQREYEYKTGAEAIINVEKTLTYLNYVADSGTVRLVFGGDDSRRLSDYLQLEGALTGRIKLPGSAHSLDEVPFWVPSRYNDEDVWTSSDGSSKLPTIVRTTADKLERIVEIVSNDPEIEDRYPLRVTGGEFVLDVGDETGNSVSGVLSAESVEGPDVANYFYAGFAEVADAFDGSIELQMAPGGEAPLCVVSEGENSMVGHTISCEGVIQ